MCRWEGIFLVSPLDSSCSSDNTSGTFYTSLSTIYWQMMVIHFNDPPTQAGALHIITWARHNQFCAVNLKYLKAQCKEQEVPMQFTLYPVTSNSHKECYYA